jgi:hypothetical protein
LKDDAVQRKEMRSKRRELRHKRQELRKAKDEQRAAKNLAENRKHQRRTKRVQVELFQLEREIHAAQDGRPASEQVTGALPDFAVIGAEKAGTTFLHHLLTQHPHVEPAASKELHFFDNLFDLGFEWYRRCFPKPTWKDERRTITGEATPYLHNPLAPERMAQVVPQARLIALLRNPVNRAYSRYHQVVRRGWETRTFEEAIEGEEPWLVEAPQHGYRATVDDAPYGYLSWSIYVDHLQRWSEFFPREQMLILKSEDFFERPVDTIKVVLDFLGLPEWEPEASNLQKKRNTREYEGMDPATRRRLEEYFEPHNRRLYDYLGKDFGW